MGFFLLSHGTETMNYLPTRPQLSGREELRDWSLGGGTTTSLRQRPSWGGTSTGQCQTSACIVRYLPAEHGPFHVVHTGSRTACELILPTEPQSTVGHVVPWRCHHGHRRQGLEPQHHEYSAALQKYVGVTMRVGCEWRHVDLHVHAGYVAVCIQPSPVGTGCPPEKTTTKNNTTTTKKAA